MAAVSTPRDGRRSLLGRTGLTTRLRKAARKWLGPARPALANLASVPLFVIGLACGVAAFAVWCTMAGLLAAMVALIVLENVIADEG